MRSARIPPTAHAPEPQGHSGGHTTWDLDADDQQIYFAMLADSTAGVAELGARTGLSEPRVRRALDNLAEHSLLSPNSESSLQVVPPRAGFGRLLAEAESDLMERQRKLAAARATLNDLVAEHERYRDQEMLIRLTTLDAVRHRLGELAMDATQECVSFNPGRQQLPDAIEASKPLNQQVLERGVEIRCVYQTSFRNDQATVAYAHWLSGLGGRARTVAEVPFNLVIVDREVAILPGDLTQHRVGALELRSPSVVSALHVLFETVWGQGEPFGSEPTTDDHGLTATERGALALLSAGHTDESAARRLDISVRTLRRSVAAVTERLGAASRFQLGAEAARRGWI